MRFWHPFAEMGSLRELVIERSPFGLKSGLLPSKEWPIRRGCAGSPRSHRLALLVSLVTASMCP